MVLIGRPVDPLYFLRLPYMFQLGNNALEILIYYKVRYRLPIKATKGENMDIATTLRYGLINLNHFRRCMMSRMSHQILSYGKKVHLSLLST